MADNNNKVVQSISLGVCGLGVLLLVILLPVSVKNVGHDEYGIRYDGLTKKVHRQVYEEGKTVCTPQTKMITYGRTIQKLGLDMTSMSLDGIQMAVKVDIQYLIHKSQVFTIFEEFGEEEDLKSYLYMVADDSVRDSIGTFTAMNFYQSRAAIQSKIEEDMIESMKNAKARINVTTVVMTNYDFPPELSNAITNKRSAQNEITIALSEHEGQIMEAETEFLKAEINAERLAIEAEGEVQAILAEAEAKNSSIVEVWANRNSTYSHIKETLGLDSNEFVEQYLTSVVLQAANDPVISLSVSE